MKMQTLFLNSFIAICCLGFGANAQDIRPNQTSVNNAKIPVVAGSKGDVDSNGFIEIFDLIRARDIAIGKLANPGETQVFAADINSDGAVTRGDVEKIRDILLLKSIPPPTIFSMEPASARVGEQVKINGAGFDLILSGNLVRFKETQATVVAATATELRVIVPQGASSGSVTVTVNEQSSNAVNFEVTVSGTAPLISDITPAAAMRQQEVVVTGERFGTLQSNSVLKFSEVVAQTEDIVSWSDTEIRLNVPKNAYPGFVTATVNSEVSNAFQFNVVVVEATPPDSADFAETQDGIRYVRNEIILDFKNDVGLPEISDFLAQNNLTQAGIIFRLRLIQARISDGRDPFSLAKSLAENPLLDGALPSYLTEQDRGVSESYPGPILNSYNSTTATFSEIRYHHFAMGTYAGHRLAEAILEGVSNIPDVRVAVVDAGLGDGRTSEPEFGSRIKDPTVVGFKEAAPTSIFFSGVTTLDKIVDEFDSHGSQVSGAAAASGAVALGTGKHINLRPIKTSTSMYLQIGGVEIASSDPKVKVINISWGHPTDPLLELLFGGGWFGEIGAAGKIVVTSAGNDGIDAGLLFPKVVAPDRPRKPGDPAIMVVSASVARSNNAGSPFGEFFANFFSNFGSKISVSAPGVIAVLQRDYSLSGDSGTSFAAPLVSGLAGEMFLLDKVIVQSGKRPAEMTEKQIINIIEATADDLGASGPDDLFGNGRINVWKALLTVVNGGLDLSDPEWYGFEIRAAVDAPSPELTNQLVESFKFAQVYIDDIPLTDAGNTAMPVKEIKLFKRVPPPTGTVQNTATPLIPTPNSTTGDSQFLSTFSITRNEIAGSGSDFKKLQLRQGGKAAGSPPFFEMPLDLAHLQDLISSFVNLDDYVFTIEIPRLIELQVMDNGSPITLTDKIDGKDVKLPIGSKGETVDIKISYTSFTPSAANTDIAFFGTTQNSFLMEPQQVTNTPGQIVTSTIQTSIHERAETGPVTVRTTEDVDEPMVSFASLTDLIVPKVVGVNPQGTEPGDLVLVSINVPHFGLDAAKIKIKFPGDNPEVQPKAVSAGSTPEVTHVLETEIPQNLQNGPVKVILEVDNSQFVEFEGGFADLAGKTAYAGTVTITELTIVIDGEVFNETPPAGKNVLPVRFTLNKLSGQGEPPEDKYFLTAPAENLLLNVFDASTTAALNNDEIVLEISEQGAIANVNVKLDQENQSLQGTYSLSGGGLTLKSTLAAEVETEPAIFNGIFTGRYILQSTSGDPQLQSALGALVEDQLFPLGFMQVDDLAAINVINQEGSGSNQSAMRLAIQPIERLQTKLNGLTSRQDDLYALLTYIVGTTTGNNWAYEINDAFLFPDGDPNPDRNANIKYSFTRNDQTLTSTLQINLEVKEDEQTRTGQANYAFTGGLQPEDQDKATIVGILPTPEKGFPTVVGNSVTLQKVNLSYNFVSADEGKIVLAAFKNGDRKQLLAVQEKPLNFVGNRAGIAIFSGFTIPNVDDSVTTISIEAVIMPPDGSTIYTRSNVLSYSR